MAVFTNEDGDSSFALPDEFNIVFPGFYNGSTGGYQNLGADDNDVILGGVKSDVIHLTAGVDIIDASQGTGDTIDATLGMSLREPGFDGEWYRAEAGNLTVDLAAGTYTVDWQKADGTFLTSSSGTLAGIEIIYSGIGDDILLGTNATPITDGGRVEGEIFHTGGGKDFVNGRGGVDTIGVGQYTTSSIIFDGVIVDVAAGTLRGLDGITDTFKNIERFSMTPNADTFIGDKNDNWVTGYGGGDTLTGGKGFDVLDYKYAADGGTGIIVDTASRIVSGGIWTETFKGFEQIRGTQNYDTMRGSSGNDNFFGDNGIDTLRGLDGDDILDGEDDNDILIGGKGDDILIGGEDDDDLKGGDDDDHLSGGEGIDTVDGGKGVDTLNFFIGNPQDFTLGINVTLKNGKVIDPWGNNETVTSIENVYGTQFRDLIKGDKNDNNLFGSDGRDNLGGLGGKDRLGGGDGKDTLGGGDGRDRLFGDAGDDTLFGGKGDDFLSGGDDDDKLFGEKGADELKGGAGDDELSDKSATVSGHVIVKSVRDGLANGKLTKSFDDTFDGLTNKLFGGVGKDTLLGSGVLDGGADNDVLRGLGVLKGGAGNDKLFADSSFASSGEFRALLIGGLGKDTLTGTSGTGANATDIWVSYDYSTARLVLDLSKNSAKLGGGDSDTLVNIRTVVGTRFDDSMKNGTSGKDELFGHNGDDSLFVRTTKKSDNNYGNGGAGEDTLLSLGNGEARLVGGDDNDTITVKSRISEVNGGKGNDTIKVFGSFKADVVHEIAGGSGNDTILFNSSVFASAPRLGSFASISGGAGNDKITLRGPGSGAETAFFVKGGAGSDTLILSGAGLSVDFQDFQPSQDKLNLKAALPGTITSFEKLKDAAEEIGGNVEIELQSGLLTLSGVEISDLSSSMFIF